MKKTGKSELEKSNIAEKNFFNDVDRMINEGLGGGTVNRRKNSGKIEEARDLEAEYPPHFVENSEEE
ncbi:hypothetical protein [Salipaludibacillus aurantiacus]|uniref:Uncharacterized protein n=1 Tax=Salipaludibacillus aurantiacus TaxID=1601833 RepID=A0A1H9VTN7_9BACI|nr:hypothetical protein [Salipaludibacillus aurantiacus]SES25086.1 hypothetical protein SAMN05518684_112102 [Salipaludibacillus aurantiacus]